MSEISIEEVAAICEPILKYLSMHNNPYAEICITESGIQVKEIVMGIPNGWQPTETVDCPADQIRLYG